MLAVVPDGCPGDEGGKDRAASLIDEIVREGARRMLAEALRRVGLLATQASNAETGATTTTVMITARIVLVTLLSMFARRPGVKGRKTHQRVMSRPCQIRGCE